MIGDIGATVTALADALHQRVKPAGEFLKLRDEIRAHINERAEDDRFPGHSAAPGPRCPQGRCPKTASSASTTACTRSGSRVITAPRSPTRCLLDNALATMGAGLPSAIAAKCLNPHKRVLAVCGDGGFMMNSQEMETAVRLKLDLVVLVIEDNAYGMIRWKQGVDHFADFGMTFGNPDFVAYAQFLWRAWAPGRGDGRIDSDAGAGLHGKAACIWSWSRSTTARTCACWSRSSATGASGRRLSALLSRSCRCRLPKSAARRHGRRQRRPAGPRLPCRRRQSR